jgi:hypothetical protein
MSIKQQFADVVAEFPEGTTVEEAFERLYSAFKEKLRRNAPPLGTPALSGPRRPRPFGMDAGLGRIAPDFDAPLPEDLQQAFFGDS